MQLFYMNNKLHDIFYKFGFTESARNFQGNNFNNGGLGGDAVKAEAFSDNYNNAMFNPGFERTVNGVNQVQTPRMYMLLLTVIYLPSSSGCFYNAPADVVNRPVVTSGTSIDFGPAIMEFPITEYVDIPSDPTGCTTLVGSLVGKRALVTIRDVTMR